LPHGKVDFEIPPVTRVRPIASDIGRQLAERKFNPPIGEYVDGVDLIDSPEFDEVHLALAAEPQA
jgi:hypothetical protein